MSDATGLDEKPPMYISDKEGNDEAGDGSEQKPFKTLIQAMRASGEPFPRFLVGSSIGGQRWEDVSQAQQKMVGDIYMSEQFKHMDIEKKEKIKKVKSSLIECDITDTNLAEKMKKLNRKPSVTRVFVIYTGGTIGTIEGRGPEGGFFNRILASPLKKYFSDDKYDQTSLSSNTYALPKRGKNQIIYEVYEYPKDELKVSSNIHIEDWIKIAKHIQEKYDYFDGFVILHGTDTMAYTSSALSFMFEKPCKPIVLTGSQIPMFDKDEKPRIDSDASDNLLGALCVAGHVAIPEVTLFFDKKLFRGNRVIKFVSNKMDAFLSPNFSPLLVVDNIEMLYDMYPVQTHLTERDQIFFKDYYVGMLRFFPGITAETVQNFMKAKKVMKGLILETFGAGHGPTDAGILKELKKATDGGMLILNCTQCVKGIAPSNKKNGKASYLDVGVIPGEDITSEAALAKLLYILSKSNQKEEQLKMMKSNLRGEVTVSNE